MRWLIPRLKHPTLTKGPMTAEGDVIDGRGDEQWFEAIFRHSLPRVARRAPGGPTSYMPQRHDISPSV